MAPCRTATSVDYIAGRAQELRAIVAEKRRGSTVFTDASFPSTDTGTRLSDVLDTVVTRCSTTGMPRMARFTEVFTEGFMEEIATVFMEGFEAGTHSSIHSS